MTTISSVLVATELSADGINTVRRAALLAQERGASLHLLHTLQAPGSKPPRSWFRPTIDMGINAALARRALQRLAVEISGAYDIVPTIEVLIGDPYQSLAQSAAQADLVVLGQRSQGLLQAWLTGRTVDRLLKMCRRPVLVVKAPDLQPYRRILLPISLTASSDAAIRVTACIRGDAGVQVFHAIDSDRHAVLSDADVPAHIIRETRAKEEAGIDARMRRKVARLGLQGESISFSLRHGPVVNTTLSHARHLGADLVVAGRMERLSWGELLRGSVSVRILTGSSCDVLIVPKPLEDSLSPATPLGELQSGFVGPVDMVETTTGRVDKALASI